MTELENLQSRPERGLVLNYTGATSVFRIVEIQPLKMEQRKYQRRKRYLSIGLKSGSGMVCRY